MELQLFARKKKPKHLEDYPQPQRNVDIGTFFVRMVCNLFKGKILPYGDPRGDLFSRMFDCFMEVKACGTNNVWSIGIDQLQKHLNNPSLLYVFVRWGNTVYKRGVRHVALNKTVKTPAQLVWFLSHRPRPIKVYVVDATIVDALFKKNGVGTIKNIHGDKDKRECVFVTIEHLERFVLGDEKFFVEHGLDKAQFAFFGDEKDSDRKARVKNYRFRVDVFSAIRSGDTSTTEPT